MTRPITFGLMVFPQASPYAELAERWRRAEGMGFDSIWVADDTPMEFPGVIEYEAWSLLGALARETTTVRIGSLVSPVTFRHPLLLALSAVTVDHESGGRVTVGIGAGGAPKDDAAFGASEWTPRDRMDRLEAQLQILEPLLRGETVTRSDGPYRTADAFVGRTIQQPRPTILVAAQGPRGLRAVARYADIWNTVGGQPLVGAKLAFEEAVAATSRQVELLEGSCKAIGRDPASVRRSVFLWRYDPYASDEAFATYVERYRPLGFDEFIFFSPFADAPERQAEQEAMLERVARDVMPRLRRA